MRQIQQVLQVGGGGGVRGVRGGGDWTGERGGGDRTGERGGGDRMGEAGGGGALSLKTGQLWGGRGHERAGSQTRAARELSGQRWRVKGHSTALQASFLLCNATQQSQHTTPI